MMHRLMILVWALPLTAAEPPVVTARTWAILDGRTGKPLFGHDADKPAKAASTAKIMCARVVLNLAAKNPKILDEVVTYSKLADDTTGSTSAIKVGESLPVKEVLFGLMLPSGNDAGNALGEHFNARLDPPGPDIVKRTGLDSGKVKTRANFIAEMNREAAKLGLKNTIYRSTYGDGGTDKEMTISPNDLGTLAFECLKDERFRNYVKTQSHEAKVKTPDGGERTQKWTNTNKLLAKGYDGVKTGTTNQAGACLISRAWKEKESRICVVLGCKESDDRYKDTEALLAWAWAERK